MKYLILLFSFNCFAQQPLVRPLGANRAAYQEFIIHHPQYSNVTSNLIEKERPPAKSKNLLRLFYRAQQVFFKGSLSEAARSFELVVNQAYESHWKAAERKLIVRSFFRLAQIQRDQQSNWISKAIAFDSQLSPDPNLFRPQIISMWKRFKKELPVFLWTFPAKVFLFDKMLFNGKLFNLSEAQSLELAPGHCRITLLSSAYSPQTFRGDVNQLENWQPNLEPLSSSLSNSELAKVRYYTKSLDGLSEPLKKVEPATNSLKKFLPNRVSAPLLATKRVQPHVQKPWYKKGWVWTAVLGLSAYAIYQNQHTPSSPVVVPTHQTE